jgi:hypothetical protein
MAYLFSKLNQELKMTQRASATWVGKAGNVFYRLLKLPAEMLEKRRHCRQIERNKKDLLKLGDHLLNDLGYDDHGIPNKSMNDFTNRSN